MDFTELKGLLTRNRSYRRFDQSVRIPRAQLEDMVQLATLTASGRNLQPLKYVIIDNEDTCNRLFPALAWAGYLTEWPGPEEGERPAAYIVQLLDTEMAKEILCDDGLQLEAISLGATALGYGGCIIKAFNKQMVLDAIELPAHLEPRYIFALGRPVEKVVIDTIENGDYKYWRDDEKIHHVPKRRMNEILVN